MQKKKTRDFSGIISYPLNPPSGANFTTEQISCKFMVHHEPWGTSQFTCPLLANLQKLCVSYMPSLSGTQMFNANSKFANIVVWQREPLCAAVSRFSYCYKVFAPLAKLKTDLAAFCEPFPLKYNPKMCFVTSIWG